MLAKPVYTLLFGAGNDPEMGSIILQYYAPACILFSLFTVTAAMLQGINQQQKTVLGLVIGIIVKIVFKYCIASVFRLCKFYYFNIRWLHDFSWL